MIIFDEYNYVRGIIETHTKPPQMGIRKLINYIAMYYYDDFGDGCLLSSYATKVQDEMKQFNFPFIVYQEYLFAGYIKKICQKCQTGKLNHNLRNGDPVIITRKEVELIKSAPTEKMQKVLFSFYVIAKKMGTSGWINYSLKDVFEYADVRMKQDERHFMIYELKELGLLQINHIINKTGYKVELYPDSEPEFEIYTFEHCGNQFICRYKPGWMMCEICGRMIKRKAPNQKYCKSCAKIVNIYKTKEQKV